MLRVNQLNGFGARSEPFNVQLGEARANASTLSGTQATFSDLYAGPPYRNRYLVVVLNFRQDSNPSSVIFGETTGTLAVTATRTVTSPDIRTQIYYALVPHRISFGLVVNWPGFLADASITLYRVASPGNMTFDTASANATTNVNTTIDVAAGGALIGGVCQNQNETTNFSGINKDIHIAGASGFGHVSASQTGLSAQVNRAVSVSGGSTERTLAVLSISP